MWAIILDIWKDQPVYHSPAGQNGHGVPSVRCGRPIGNYKPWLPLKHVQKFARPCKSCFPGGDTT